MTNNKHNMKLNRYLALMAILGTFSLASSVRADDTITTNATDTTVTTTTTTNTTVLTQEKETSTDLYRSRELDFDLFASAVVAQQTAEHFSESSYEHHGYWGGGGGITGYFCRYVGIGGDFNAGARSGSFVDSASGNVYLRLPILQTGLAPYAFGGGGYQFENVRQSFGQGGAGLEFRFCKNLGVFVDGRWVFNGHTENSGLARAGLRISF